jgi:hypothetical protein
MKAANTAPDSSRIIQKKTVRAKEFIAAFRERPDDSYLMDRFNISARNLGRIYSTLMEKGMLSEHEYNQREVKAPELDAREHSHISTSLTVSLVEDPTEALTERIEESDPRLGGEVSQAQGVQKAQQEVADLCPNCRKPKNSSSPEECIYCGVVFRKFEVLSRKRGNLVDR